MKNGTAKNHDTALRSQLTALAGLFARGHALFTGLAAKRSGMNYTTNGARECARRRNHGYGWVSARHAQMLASVRSNANKRAWAAQAQEVGHE